MNIQFDKISTKQFFSWLANKIFELMLPELLFLIKEEINGEELLTRKEVSEQILKCDVNTADKEFLYKSGFPYLQVGKNRKYPKKQVEKWISENTNYN